MIFFQISCSHNSILFENRELACYLIQFTEFQSGSRFGEFIYRFNEFGSRFDEIGYRINEFDSRFNETGYRLNEFHSRFDEFHQNFRQTGPIFDKIDQSTSYRILQDNNRGWNIRTFY